MANCCFRKIVVLEREGWLEREQETQKLGGSGDNNPDRIMMVWSSVVVVYKNLIWEITIVGNRKIMVGQGFSCGETILHGSHVHLQILQVMPRMQYSLSRPFLRVVFVATKLEE